MRPATRACPVCPVAGALNARIDASGGKTRIGRMSKRGDRYVRRLLVNGANHVERHPVRVSGTTDSGVIIADGLTGTERVVATAGGFLRDGETVRVAPPVNTQPVAGTH